MRRGKESGVRTVENVLPAARTFVYGTGNPAKLQSMRDYLAPLRVEIIGLNETGAAVSNVDEYGKSLSENARIKALSYYAVLKRPVFACDSGLYIDGLPEEEQPGVHVRTVKGKRLSDREMTAHYAAIARRLGGRAMARYRNAICLIANENEIYEYSGDGISGEAFYLVDRPHPRRVEGFPLDRLSVRVETGEYYYANDTCSVADKTCKGFQTFFSQVLAAVGSVETR